MSRKFKPLPELSYLQDRLTYNPLTGVIYWKDSPRNGWLGKPAGYVLNNGYILIELDGEGYLAHRLAWFMYTGVDPVDHEIDHRDLDRTNNKIKNLRCASHSDNMINTRRRSNNTSGQRGVSFNKRAKRWACRIQKDGRRLFLGYFDSKAEASAAYLNAAPTLHGSFSRTQQGERL